MQGNPVRTRSVIPLPWCRLDEATKDIMKLERGLEQKVGPPPVMHCAMPHRTRICSIKEWICHLPPRACLAAVLCS